MTRDARKSRAYWCIIQFHTHVQEAQPPFAGGSQFWKQRIVQNISSVCREKQRKPHSAALSAMFPKYWSPPTKLSLAFMRMTVNLAYFVPLFFICSRNLGQTSVYFVTQYINNKERREKCFNKVNMILLLISSTYFISNGANKGWGKTVRKIRKRFTC